MIVQKALGFIIAVIAWIVEKGCENNMLSTVVLNVSLIAFGFMLGLFLSASYKKKPKDGFFIVDDRGPDKTQIIVDLAKDPDELKKKKTITFRVLEKK